MTLKTHILSLFYTPWTMISLCSYSMLTPIFFLLLYVWGGGKKAQSVGLPLHSICSYRLNNTCMTRCLVNRTGHQQATQTFGLYRGSNGTTLLSFWCLNVDSCLEFKLSELDSCTRSPLNSYSRPHFLEYLATRAVCRSAKCNKMTQLLIVGREKST